MHQKKLQIAETEKASTLNKVYNGNKKKEKVEKTEKDGNDKKGWNEKETIDFMSVAIFNLKSDERMNGLACCIKQYGWQYKQYKLSSNIPPIFVKHFIQHVRRNVESV